MMENGCSKTSATVGNFDLTSECPNYFKSSFARSMAFNTSSTQSKSLDYVYLDEGATIDEEMLSPASPVRQVLSLSPLKKSSTPEPPPIRKPPFTPRRSVPTIPTFEIQREFSLRNSSSSSRPVRPNDAIKFWKMKQEGLKNGGSNNGSLWADMDPQEESKEEEILRLRKECQGLMEANRKLQQSASSIDASLLQAQVDTLQWQLKQAESNRQMYKAVMEQVSKFLERVHKTLEASTTSKLGSLRSKARVPRSRSVHTVAHSRASSPSASVHRANSISQIQDSYCAFRDYACRASRSMVGEEVAPERLSQEAFRLLRTIQSLLGTREPDLARVSDNDTSERRDSTSVSLTPNLSPSHMGSCSSLVQSVSRDTGEDSSKTCGGPATPQLSVGSTEDESGFSSMSSFHEVGLPEIGSTASSSGGSSTGGSSGLPPGPGSFHELGLPIVDTPPPSSSSSASHRHRRWSSTPVEQNGYAPQREALRVLWCSRKTPEVVPNCAYKMKNIIPISRTSFSKNGYNELA